MMDIHQILKQLPHRYPFLLVDRVLEVEKGKSIKALKNVSVNEPQFTGHFPHRPVFPGVLQLEALAQAAALLAGAAGALTQLLAPDHHGAGLFRRLDRHGHHARGEGGGRQAIQPRSRTHAARVEHQDFRPAAPVSVT